MNKIKWIIFALVSVGIVVGLVIYSNNTDKPSVSDNVDIFAVQAGNSEDGNIADHIYGNADSKVTLIEYGDYQCPGCGTYNPIIQKITEDYKLEIRYIFRNYLLSYHANAKAAAATAESAGLQGKFWEMHEKLYENQADWESLDSNARTTYFAGLALGFGLDINKFNTDIASSSVTDKINYDISLAKKSSLSATPAFYLNGEEIKSKVWEDETAFRALIDSKIVEAKK